MRVVLRRARSLIFCLQKNTRHRGDKVTIKSVWNDVKTYKREFWIALLIYVVGLVATFAIGWFVFGEDELRSQLLEIKKSFESSGMSDSNTPFMDMVFLFIKNTRAAFLLLILGFIPFGIGTAFLIGSNGALVGFVLLAGEVMNGQAFEMFVFGILPHGITELIAFLLASAIGFKLTIATTRKLRTEDLDGSLEVVWKRSVRIFLVVIVPLLVVSAFLEAYVTPLILNMFT